MCLALYLAASKPLAILPWDSANPAFHVIDLPEAAAGMRKHFRSEHVYYVGSQQGCSCAFNYEREFDAILQLKGYLRASLTSVEEVELFCSQLGNEEQVVQHSVMTSPDGIVLPEFLFKDGQYLVICSAKSLKARRRLELRRQTVSPAPA